MPTPCTLSVNSWGEQSDFELGDVVIWDRGLDGETMQLVSDLMLQKIRPERSINPTPAPFQSKVSVDYDAISGIPAWGIYRAKDYKADVQTLTEARGNGRDAKGSGLLVHQYTDPGYGSSVPVESIRGNVRSKLIWPANSIPKGSHSVCAITRYSDDENNRILTGTNPGSPIFNTPI